MDSYILCGMQFGDEGKGTFVDYLAHEKNIDCVVRYNGGSQASHTVITPEGKLHKFSQLGSGMFLDKCHTYITENMVINLDNLMVEMEIFSEKTGIQIPDLMDRIHIHENCYVVTPYHKLLNKLRELSLGNNRRGSVGTGVSEVRYLLDRDKTYLFDQPLGLQVKDIFNIYSNNPIYGKMEDLQFYVEEFYQKNKEAIINNTSKDIKESLDKEIEYLLRRNAFLRISMDYINRIKRAPANINFIKCIYNTYEQSYRKKCKSAIFEGSQGLLIDANYGIKPNTTYLDTTNNFALDISYYRDNISKIGITKAFESRHGLGVFPTEIEEVSSKISDENQDASFWNGSIRFGWFDAVLLRYAQRINDVDELYLSSLDKLDKFDTIKVCNEYIYKGNIDSRMKTLFDYYTTPEGDIIIKNIRRAGSDLTKYLEKCIPKFISLDGWNTDISKATNVMQLPIKCIRYIEYLESITRIPITLVSVGPTRDNKIVLKEVKK